MELNKTIALISGGASGMGAATAKMLTIHGAKVILLDSDIEKASILAAEIGGLAFSCDVTQENVVSDAIKKIITEVGVPRICVNCAGIIASERMISKKRVLPLSEFQRVVNVNLLGTFNVMRLAAAAMIEAPALPSEEQGIIINTASVAAFDGQIGQIAYSASKGGIVAMTLPAARELAQFGIRVMTIAPGLVDTPLFEKIPTEARTALAASVPFPKRLAQPSEYALLVKQIIENPMLNGSVIRLDGALRMAPK